ncbi:MAG: cupin domain-containing protein [Sneathiella sp.]|nr:cupin domain-containing protein [Sneathiella sp.]
MISRILAAFLICACLTGIARAGEPYSAIEKLLQTSTTVQGQPFEYPKSGTPEVTAVIVTMKPGEKTATHLHEAPMFAYMLEGELTVHYDGHGEKVYKAGDALMEAMEIWHMGVNTGATPVRVLAVFMGAKGTKDTVVHP